MGFFTAYTRAEIHRNGPACRANIRTPMRLAILDRYLLREMLPPFAFALAAYLLFWVINILFIAADYIFNQHAPLLLVLKFLVFRIPQAIPMAFPFACLVAGLLAVGRMMGSNEVTAMRASGISVYRIAAAPLLFGAVIFGVSYYLNEYVAPPAVDQSTRAFYQMIYHTDSLPVEPQLFRKNPQNQQVIYVSSVLPDNRTLSGVQVFKTTPNGRTSQTIQAPTGVLGDGRLIMSQAIISNFDANGFVTKQDHADNVSVDLPMHETPDQFLSSVNTDPWASSREDLQEQVQVLKAQGIGGPALGNLEVSLANKIAWPFASIVGVLLSVSLAMLFGRRGRTVAIALGILSFVVYFLLTTAASAVGKTGIVSPYLACWMPNILMTAFGTIVLWLVEPTGYSVLRDAFRFLTGRGRRRATA